MNKRLRFMATTLLLSVVAVLSCAACTSDQDANRASRETFMVGGGGSATVIHPRGQFLQKDIEAASQICHSRNQTMVLQNPDDPASRTNPDGRVQGTARYVCTDAVVQKPSVLR